MALLNALPSAIAQGLIWGIMAIGVYITFRILDIADLTVDGSFATGGAVAAGDDASVYDHATAYAKEIGCTFLTLNVWQGNDSAMRFYENAGMSPRSITMEKKLC